MSVDYKALTVIGVSLGMSQVYPTVQKKGRGCAHEVKATDAFCPACGKPREIVTECNEESVLRNFPAKDELYDEDWIGPKTGIVWQLHREQSYDGNGNDLYIGVICEVQQDDSDVFDPTPNVTVIRDELRMDLGSLWDPESFGIYTLCESS